MDGKYDALDHMILGELREDAQQSYRQLASKLKVHPNTLMQRIKKLEREKIIIKYTVDIDFGKLGLDYHSITLLKTGKARVGKDIWEFDDLLKIPQIQAFYATTGIYDAMAVIRVRDRDEMLQVIKRLQENRIVMRSNTHMILKTFKHPTEYNPFK